MTRFGNIAPTVYSYSNRKKNFSSSIAIDRLTTKQEDELLDYYGQLVSEDYRGYYVKRLRLIGKHEFVRRADRALKYGKNPQKLFNHLMK